MNCELLSGVVVVSSGLHLRCIVAIAELGEAEATHVLEAVHLSHNGQVALRVKASQCASEQIELHCELGGEGAVNLSKHFVGRENVMRVSLKVKNRDKLLITDSFYSVVGLITQFIEWHNEFVRENVIFKEFLPLGALFNFVAEKFVFKVARSLCVKLTQDLDIRVLMHLYVVLDTSPIKLLI